MLLARRVESKFIIKFCIPAMKTLNYIGFGWAKRSCKLIKSFLLKFLFQSLFFVLCLIDYIKFQITGALDRLFSQLFVQNIQSLGIKTVEEYFTYCEHRTDCTQIDVWKNISFVLDIFWEQKGSMFLAIIFLHNNKPALERPSTVWWA